MSLIRQLYSKYRRIAGNRPLQAGHNTRYSQIATMHTSVGLMRQSSDSIHKKLGAKNVISHAHASGSWSPSAVYDVQLDEPFQPSLCPDAPPLLFPLLRVEEMGAHTLPPERTVVIFPSFSHSAHVASNAGNQAPGWWEPIVGSGKAIDTRHWRVMCISPLGSPYSLTNPTTTDPHTGKQYRTSFPQLSPTDLAICHSKVLRQLGITAPVHAVVGSSMGGMQALQFASLFPAAAKRVIAIACTGRTTPFTVGIRRMQRKAILTDPAYHAGNYADFGTAPVGGLSIARELGTLFYRSRDEFDSRFKWEPSGDKHFTSMDTWEVESYLNYQGARFVRTYDANSYLLLSKCMDLMDLGDGVEGRKSYAEGAARICANTMLVGVKQDALIPMRELEQLAEAMRQTGGKVDFHAMDSVYGHDAFLKEDVWLGNHVRRHLEAGLETELENERVHNTGHNAP